MKGGMYVSMENHKHCYRCGEVISIDRDVCEKCISDLLKEKE